MESTSQLMRSSDLIMGMDHSQFYIHGGGGVDSVFDLVEDALEGQKWASNGRSVVVITPFEYNFSMHVHVELWTDVPANDATDWAVFYTTEIHISTGLLQLESTGGAPTETPIPNGMYTIDIAGRNFPDSFAEESHERWRIRLWPHDLSDSDNVPPSKADSSPAATPAPTEGWQPVQAPPPQLHLRNAVTPHPHQPGS